MAVSSGVSVLVLDVEEWREVIIIMYVDYCHSLLISLSECVHGCFST